MGSAPAPGAVFRALAENGKAHEKSDGIESAARPPDAERGARSATPGAGVLPGLRSSGLIFMDQTFRQPGQFTFRAVGFPGHPAIFQNVDDDTVQ